VEPGYSGSFNALSGTGYVPEGDEATDLCVVIVIQDAAGDFHRFDGAGVLTSMAIRRAETRLIEAAREPYDGGCAPNF
jgi:hypothetical protein